MADAILTMPEEPGLYWYFCEALNDYKACEVKDREGLMVARFMDGSFQRWVGNKSYFIGPIGKPIISETGVINL